MRKMGLRKLLHLSQFVPFFYDFYPISEFYTFFSTFPRMYFWQSLTIPHFPPFPPFSPTAPHIPPFSLRFPPFCPHFPIFPIPCG